MLSYSHFHKGLAESPDRQQCSPYLGRLWMEGEGDMVNVNTQVCRGIPLPSRMTINKTEIKQAQTDLLFHNLWIIQLCHGLKQQLQTMAEHLFKSDLRSG